MLRAAFLAKRWGPEILHHDADAVHQMTAMISVYEVVARVKNMHGADIHKLTPGERVQLRMLKENGLL